MSHLSLPLGTSPLSIVPGPDSALWFTESDASRIAKIDPSSASVKNYSTGITPGSNPVDLAAVPTETSGSRSKPRSGSSA